MILPIQRGDFGQLFEDFKTSQNNMAQPDKWMKKWICKHINAIFYMVETTPPYTHTHTPKQQSMIWENIWDLF